jgi:hypothetical protein
MDIQENSFTNNNKINMTQLEIAEIFLKKGYTYNKETGEIFNSRGKLSKTLCNGYLKLVTSVNKNIYQIYGHRFAWYYTYGELPKETIDHINKNRSDNRITNLRDISLKKNIQRILGKGVIEINLKSGKRWIAQIGVLGQTRHIGYFYNEVEAREAYLKAKINIEELENFYGNLKYN